MSIKPPRISTGLLVLVALAFLGLVLVAAPSWFAAQIEVVSRFGKPWLYLYLTVVGLGGILFAGSTGWIVWKLWQRQRSKQQRQTLRMRDPSELTPAELEKEFEANLAAFSDLQRELAVNDPLRGQLDPLVRRLHEKREKQQLEIVAFGAISSGKSSLLNALAGRDLFVTDLKGGTTLQRNEVPWPGVDEVVLVDTPGLAEVDGEEHAQIAMEAARGADMVLLVIDGPLREWEVQLVQRLATMEKRIIVCLNKSDWYDRREQESLFSQIREQVRDSVQPEDVVAVRSQVTQRPQRHLFPDGTHVDRMVDVPPDISPLADRMLGLVQKDGRELLLANLLLQSRGLVDEGKERVRRSLDRRAWETVDIYMWGAGSAAALSPWPVLDLLAGTAVSTKMVVDLGQIYRQEIDLNSAVRLLGQLGKQLLGILGVTAATPAVAAGVASLLKTVPGAGTLAGGILQGVVQALVTRWIGGVFIGYFREELHQSPSGLADLARREWQRVTTLDELRKLVQTARTRLLAKEERSSKA